jgi:hypothetical protein
LRYRSAASSSEVRQRSSTPLPKPAITTAKAENMETNSGRSDAAPTRADAVRALGSLTSVERVIYGKLMMRQLNQPTAARLLERYGPAGVVRIISARAMNVSLAVLVAIAVAFAVFGEGIVAGALFAVASLLLVAVCVRSISAARLGRRWRAGLGSTLR